MTTQKKSNEIEEKSSHESGEEDSEDESEILEESPCGRWSKRRQQVQQRDVPGIEAAYLAMDTEEGMEVVWNEVRFSERRNFKDQEKKIEEVFDSLTQLSHPNIVKLHKYWIDTKDDKRRVVFITEYMSSGSLKKFLKLTNKNVKKLPLTSWRRWCTQILSALSYLHSCSPPIIHGNITTDSIFIQHNGLVKIGSVAPDAIQTHVKTYHGDIRNMHYIAPEYGSQTPVTPAVDIYSFGICALEMAALEIPGNGDSGTAVSKDHIQKTIQALEHRSQKDFIQKCLMKDPLKRPSAIDLLFHSVLFEVHSLKVQCAHFVINNPKLSKSLDKELEERLPRLGKLNNILAEIRRKDREPIQYKLTDVPSAGRLEKFMEDVRYGIYPLTIFNLPQPLSRPRPMSPEMTTIAAARAQEQHRPEARKIVNMMCSSQYVNNRSEISITISLRLEDKMNRQLSCDIPVDSSASALADELVQYAFINPQDRDKVSLHIDNELRRLRQEGMPGNATYNELNGDLPRMVSLVTSR